MNILVVCDSFCPPNYNSAGVQMNDLSSELSKEHRVFVMHPIYGLNNKLIKRVLNKQLSVYSIPSLSRGNFYLKRFISEITLPFYFIKFFYFSELKKKKFDLIIWYSPTIFFSFFISIFLRKYKINSYLILRDIFPEWLVDLKIINKGIIYNILKKISSFQYSLPDVIGIQSKNNYKFIDHNYRNKIQVLDNWLKIPHISKNSYVIPMVDFKKKIFVYSGNIGVAQNTSVFIKLANKFKDNKTVIFLFIGSGSDINTLIALSKKMRLKNVIFYPTIAIEKLYPILNKCYAGLVSLHPLHKTNNIPGKFISYLSCGLPIIANVEKRNELFEIINKSECGYVSKSNDMNNLYKDTIKLLSLNDSDLMKIKKNSLKLFNQKFNVKAAALKIISNFN